MFLWFSRTIQVCTFLLMDKRTDGQTDQVDFFWLVPNKTRPSAGKTTFFFLILCLDNISSTVMYSNLKASGVIHSGDNTTGEGDGDDEIITVRLQKLPSDISQLFFTVNM